MISERGDGGLRNFCEEMRRGMGRGMLAAMLMTIFPMALSALSFLPYAYTERLDASGMMVYALYKSGFYPVAFIASAFAYSTSYINDAFSGALKYQMARCGRFRFTVDRFCANAICGALGVAAGEALFFLIMRTLYPVQDIPYRVAAEQNAMMALSYARPELYYFVIILLQIPGSMVMASVALAVSTLVGNMYITLASPMIYVGLITALPQRLGGERIHELIYAPMDLGIWMNGYTLFCEHLIYCAIGLAATFAVFYLGVRRYKGE